MEKLIFSCLLFSFLYSCSSKNSKINISEDTTQIVNITIDPTSDFAEATTIIYTNALDLPEFKHCIDLGGALISDDYGIHILQNDSTQQTFFLFDEFAGRDKKGMPSWQLLDTLIIPGIGLNIGWTGNVMYEGEIDPEIIVLLPDNTDWMDSEKFTDIKKAWRFDRTQKRINEISTVGLVCLNDMYSID